MTDSRSWSCPTAPPTAARIVGTGLLTGVLAGLLVLAVQHLHERHRYSARVTRH